MSDFVSVIGAGLAGCEAALFLANNGVKVRLFDMKPNKYTDAHKYSGFSELVCSNSLKSDRLDTASGLLKAEMRALKSLILEIAEIVKVPAGSALSVDREKFSDLITEKIKSHKNIEIINEEIKEINLNEITIVATGPLTSEPLSLFIKNLLGENELSFFDAASPIVSLDSIDLDKTFFASRYNKGEADYINCPFTEEEYNEFYDALINADTVELKNFEKEYFRVYEGCMPVEVMAKRGKDTLRFGPLRPVGLYNPKTNIRPYAVLQLRVENLEKTMYNLVGFQTNLTFKAQKEVFSKIPGLENAQFIRFGVMHRNTFINSPKVLTKQLYLKDFNNTFFAGQITGVEGYMESSMCGLVCAINVLHKMNNKPYIDFPHYTMIGAILNYITTCETKDFQPIASNMGLLPKLDEVIKDKKQRYEKLSLRALNFYKKSFTLK